MDKRPDKDMLSAVSFAVSPFCHLQVPALFLAAFPMWVATAQKQRVYISGQMTYSPQSPDFSKLAVSLIAMVGFVCWGKGLYVLF